MSKQFASSPNNVSSSPPDELVKYSILLHADVDAKILKICETRRISRSGLFRQLLEDNLDNYLINEKGSAPTVGDRRITISLNAENNQLLELAAHFANLPSESVIQLLVSQGLVKFVEDARISREKVTALLSSSTTVGGELHEPIPDRAVNPGKRKRSQRNESSNP